MLCVHHGPLVLGAGLPRPYLLAGRAASPPVAAAAGYFPASYFGTTYWAPTYWAGA